MRIGYLGPAGTFSEEAAILYMNSSNLGTADYVPCTNFIDIGKMVANRELDFGLLPIENSLEGQVGTANDVVIANPALRACGEIVLPIHIHLIGKPGSSMKDCRKIFSHPQPLGQCANFLHENFPDIQQVISSSTSQAVTDMLKADMPALALANGMAARLNYAVILQENVEDSGENFTRFLVIALTDHQQTGNDKTSIWFTLPQDRPGGLYKSLKPFMEKSINLTRIESRPTKEGLGKYVFLLDLEGHRQDTDVMEAIKELEEITLTCQVIGSYPKWE